MLVMPIYLCRNLTINNIKQVYSMYSNENTNDTGEALQIKILL